MPDHLIFNMGEFEAEFPTDRMYADNHMWAQSIDDGLIRFGFTAYAVRLLQDVYFLDWLLESPVNLDRKQEIGSIESKKAESALYSPIAGELTRFNDQLMEDPSSINVDKYDKGWLFEIRPTQQPTIDAEPENEDAQHTALLSAQAYVDLLDAVWEKTQRTIKGQMNQ